MNQPQSPNSANSLAWVAFAIVIPIVLVPILCCFGGSLGALIGSGSM